MNGTTNYKNFLCVTQSQLVSQFFREKARDTLVMPTITQMKHLCDGRVSGVDWTLGWRRLLAPGRLVTRATHGGAGDRAATRCGPGVNKEGSDCSDS